MADTPSSNASPLPTPNSPPRQLSEEPERDNLPSLITTPVATSVTPGEPGESPPCWCYPMSPPYICLFDIGSKQLQRPLDPKALVPTSSLPYLRSFALRPLVVLLLVPGLTNLKRAWKILQRLKHVSYRHLPRERRRSRIVRLTALSKGPPHDNASRLTAKEGHRPAPFQVSNYIDMP